MGGDECKLWIWGSASYQQVASKLEMVDSIGGNKSGIWRFYRRVWKKYFLQKAG